MPTCVFSVGTIYKNIVFNSTSQMFLHIKGLIIKHVISEWSEYDCSMSDNIEQKGWYNCLDMLKVASMLHPVQ